MFVNNPELKQFKISIDRLKEDYLYKEESWRECDSGCRFLSGKESQERTIRQNSAIYYLITIVNYLGVIVHYKSV